MNKHYGMTLIELLISMVLSLSVIAGIGSLFLQMQKSSKIQRSLATMADESSYVQEVLQKEIRRTGGLRSRSDRNGTEADIFLPHTVVLGTDLLLGSAGLNLATGEYIKGDATTLPNPPIDDAFVIRYQLLDANDLSLASTSSNGSSPCTQNILLTAGEDPAAQEHVVSVLFYLNAGTLSCAAQRVSQDINAGVVESCTANCNTPNSTTDFTPIDAPVELINNITALKLRYGVDPDGDGAANYYEPARTIPAADWSNVISVRLSFAIRSNEDNLKNTIENYSIEGITYTPTDHRIYKVFTTTIALRNQI